MKTKYLGRVISFLMALIMAAALLPATAFAASSGIIETDTDTRDKLDTAKKGLQIIAAIGGVPGFTPATDIIFKLFGSGTDDVMDAIKKLNERFDQVQSQLNTMSADLSKKIIDAQIKAGLEESIQNYLTKTSMAITVSRKLNNRREGIYRDFSGQTRIDNLNSFYSDIPNIKDYDFGGMSFATAVINLGESITDPNGLTGLDLLETFDKLMTYTYKWEHQGYPYRTAFQANVAALYLNLSTFLRASLEAQYGAAEAANDEYKMSIIRSDIIALDEQTQKVTYTFVDHEINRLPASVRYYQVPDHEMLLSSTAVPRTIYWKNYTSNIKPYADFYQGVLHYDFTGAYDTNFPNRIRSYPTATWFKNVYDDYSGTQNLYTIFFDSTEGNINKDLYDDFRTKDGGGTPRDIREANPKFVSKFMGYPSMYRHTLGMYVGSSIKSWDEYWMYLVDAYGNNKHTRMADVDNQEHIIQRYNESFGWLSDSIPADEKTRIPDHIDNWTNLSSMIGLLTLTRNNITAETLNNDTVLLKCNDVSAELGGSYRYTWQVWRNDEHGFTDIATTVDTAQYNIGIPTPETEDFRYRCRVTKLTGDNPDLSYDECLGPIVVSGGTDFESIVPTISGMSGSYSGPYPSGITLSATGISQAIYSWEVNTDGSGFVPINGATSAAYTINPVNYSMNGYQYRCKIYKDSSKTVVLTTDAVTLKLETYGNWQDYAVTGFAGGDGSAGTPWLISTSRQLALLAERVNSGIDCSGEFFKLTANIDLNEHYWTPIGTKETPFKGSFDGNSHTIDGLAITDTALAYMGLFGYVDSGVIKNLGLNNVNVISGVNAVAVGGLVGANSGGVIDSCFATGEITGFKDNTNPGKIAVGGLAGTNVCNTANAGGKISRCYTAVSVRSTNDGTTSASDGELYAGGLVGLNKGAGSWNNNNPSITDCYAGLYTRGINKDGCCIAVGALVGWNEYSTIQRCYAKGIVLPLNGEKYTDYTFSGGIVGYCYWSTITDCYFDQTTTEKDGIGFASINITQPDITPLTTAQMTADNVLEAGGAMAALGANWFKRDNDDSGQYYPELKTLTLPKTLTAPQKFTAASDDTQVTLNWNAPLSDGGKAIIRYDVSSDDGESWTNVGLNTSYIFTDLLSDTMYTFKVRAVNDDGNGVAATATAMLLSIPYVATNETDKVTVTLSQPPNGAEALIVAVYDINGDMLAWSNNSTKTETPGIYQYEFPIDITLDAKTIKVMWWDGMNTMKQLCNWETMKYNNDSGEWEWELLIEPSE